VAANSRRRRDTTTELREVLAHHHPELDRTPINAWEDVEFRGDVEATGRMSSS
jgi:hypothetical protein